MWDLESGERRLDPLDGRPGMFTPDGTQLALRRPDQIAFVDAATGAEQSTVPLDFAVGSTGLMMSRDGRRLAVSDDTNGRIHVLDRATGQPIGQPLTLFAESSQPYPLAFLPDDRLLVASPDWAAVWHYLDGAPVFARLLPGHTGDATGSHDRYGREMDVQFTPDGTEIVITGFDDRQVLHVRARDGEPLGRVFDSAAPSSRVALSPDGSTVAVPSEADGTVSLWDRRTGRRQSVLRTGQTGQISTAWSPGGSSVLATVAEGAIVLWDVSDPRRPTEQQRLDKGEVLTFDARQPTFSPDGRVVAVNDYPKRGRVTFVDVARGRVLRRRALGGQIGALVYSPDGKTILAMRYTEGRLLLLDAATGRIRATRRVTGWPRGWEFVHGGRRIAIQSIPSSVSLGPTALELWDATTLESVGERVTVAGVAGNGGPGGASPDGTKFVTGTKSGDVVLWDLDPERWETLACRIAGRNLTRAEWNQYLPGRDYHRTCPI